jgi:hypothetical protein
LAAASTLVLLLSIVVMPALAIEIVCCSMACENSTEGTGHSVNNLHHSCSLTASTAGCGTTNKQRPARPSLMLLVGFTPFYAALPWGGGEYRIHSTWACEQPWAHSMHSMVDFDRHVLAHRCTPEPAPPRTGVRVVCIVMLPSCKAEIAGE